MASRMSSPVSTRTTPGIVSASLTSMLEILAWACGLRSTAAWSIPGNRRSLT